MGIPGLIPILSKHEVLGQAFVTISSFDFTNDLGKILPRDESVEAVYFDLPGQIHKAAAGSLAYGEYHLLSSSIVGIDNLNKITESVAIMVVNHIKDVTHLYQPEKIVIAMDGSVPAAKMKQQRERRYKAAASHKFGTFDTNQITAGSKFMVNLENKIIAMLKVMTEQSQLPNLIFYPQNLYGEGEHKLMAYMRVHANPKRWQIVYGADTDLMVLGLSQLTNIILRREDDMLHVSIPKLKEGLVQLGIAIPDFVIGISLIGNDFIPHHDVTTDRDIMRMVVNTIINTLPHVTLTYSYVVDTTGATLRGDMIDWGQLTILLNALVQRESEWLMQFNQKVVQEGNNSFVYTPQFTGINADFSNNWYSREIFHGRHHATTKVQQLDQYGQVVTKNVKIIADNAMIRGTEEDMCKHICYGLQWIMSYYMRGTAHVNSLWSYPYTYMPLFSSLLWYVGTYSANLNSTINEVLTTEANTGFHHLVHLMIALPPSSWKVSMTDSDLARIAKIASTVEKNVYFSYFPTVVKINSKDLVIRDRTIFAYKPDGVTRFVEKRVQEVPDMYFRVYIPYIDPNIVKSMVGLYPSANAHITAMNVADYGRYKANSSLNRISILKHMIATARLPKSDNTAFGIARRRESEILKAQERRLRIDVDTGTRTEYTGPVGVGVTQGKTVGKTVVQPEPEPQEVDIFSVNSNKMLEIPLEQ